ncbi:hypothetical protein DL546_000706 [Coniochaeta pulveracea]|uniref:Uncharacterized protein n=1 Tax=Coniochaeta pulveracea TaxID=177199 RepID=A0A420XXT4_9PEZI|nr:hypothetical protein DL546_000706 [Coniochaeta pulveracea]
MWEPQIPPDAVTIFSKTELSAAVGHTRTFAPHEIGTDEQARQVSATVTQLIDQIHVKPEQVNLVLIKCPSSDKLQAIRARGKVPITADTYGSMAKSRYAAAIGIAAALGEIQECDIPDAMAKGEQ